MSGLKNSPGQGSNFVNFKDGKLISNKDVVDKKGKKTGTDWSERNDWFHHFLVEKVRPRILEGAKRAEKNETETDKKMSKMGSFKKGAAAPAKDGLPF
jgi:hypothetical protein